MDAIATILISSALTQAAPGRETIKEDIRLVTFFRTVPIAAVAAALIAPPLASVGQADEWALTEALGSGQSVGVHLFVSDRGASQYDAEAAAALAPVAQLVADGLKKAVPNANIAVLTAAEARDLKPVGEAMGWSRFDYSALNKDLVLELDVKRWVESGPAMGGQGHETTLRILTSLTLFSKTELKKKIHGKGGLAGWAGGIMFRGKGKADKHADKLAVPLYVEKFREMVAGKTDKLVEVLTLPVASKVASVANAKKKMVTSSAGRTAG